MIDRKKLLEEIRKVGKTLPVIAGFVLFPLDLVVNIIEEQPEVEEEKGE